MMDIFVKLWEILSSMWSMVPAKKKQEAIEKVVDGMEEIFRKYFKDAKGKGGQA